eukprot:TRINITY_DN12120_c0_g1_i13.p1 TRINITY_DN12120_c0_g1~~TRINITY_DN12120_c0_g1_i13.p1  ORF type:complete len:830 (-),score=203.38 TRINITY_DN12120_c0_g1_i13:102-2567(-)
MGKAVVILMLAALYLIIDQGNSKEVSGNKEKSALVKSLVGKPGGNQKQITKGRGMKNKSKKRTPRKMKNKQKNKKVEMKKGNRKRNNNKNVKEETNARKVPNKLKGQKINKKNQRNKSKRTKTSRSKKKKQKTGLKTESAKSQKKNTAKQNKSKSKRKGNTKYKKFKQSSNASCTVTTTCLDKATKYMKVLKDNVENYFKQEKRMTTQNRTAGNKKGKKDVFQKNVNRLVQAGGGNSSNLKCNGNTASKGAQQMSNLTIALKNCSTSIKDKCGNIPQPKNSTKVKECSDTMTTYKKQVTECMGKSGAAACSCWLDSSLETSLEKVKSCSLLEESTDVTKGLSKCRSAFSKCRKYEDDVISAISSCSESTSSLIKKAKALTKNVAALEKAKNTTSRLASSTASSRATLTQCSEVITKNTLLVILVNQDPSSEMIESIALEISSLSTIVTCTTTEISDLSNQVSSLTILIQTTTVMLVTVQDNLATQTGTTASPDDIIISTDQPTTLIAVTTLATSNTTISASADNSTATAALSSSTTKSSSNVTSSGRTCPTRQMADNCNINCGNSNPVCTGDNEGFSFSSSADGSIYSTSWTILEGEEGATCRLLCVDENNLDVTATCSWNGQAMEWYRPSKLDEKCGAITTVGSSDSATGNTDLSTVGIEQNSSMSNAASTETVLPNATSTQMQNEPSDSGAASSTSQGPDMASTPNTIDGSSASSNPISSSSTDTSSVSTIRSDSSTDAISSATTNESSTSSSNTDMTDSTSSETSSSSNSKTSTATGSSNTGISSKTSITTTTAAATMTAITTTTTAEPSTTSTTTTQ